jgi:hypothetical protein
MSLDLSSVFAKLHRSTENFEEVKTRVSTRLNSGEFRVSMQLNADATEHVWKIHAPNGTDFTDVSVCVGDCLHNLRSALDHLVYAIAVHESGQNPPPKESTLAFPLANDPAEFKKAKNRIATLSSGAQDVIEQMQPYNRNTNGKASAVGVLAKLDDIDKHRLLQLVALMPHSTSLGGFENVVGEKKMSIVDWPKVGLSDGTVICTMSFSSPQPNFKGTFKGTFSLALHHEFGPPYSGITEIVRLLNAVGAEVEAVVKTVATAVV